MWSARFEVAGPVRAFPLRRGLRNFSGWYWAATGATDIRYESWVELSHLMRLDSEPSVEAMVSQPFRLSWRDGGQGRRVKHTPDYFVRHRDGTVVVLDVRPDGLIPPEDAVKFAATAVACAQAGRDYERVGVLDPMPAANLRRLSGYRHPRVLRVPATPSEPAAVPDYAENDFLGSPPSDTDRSRTGGSGGTRAAEPVAGCSAPSVRRASRSRRPTCGPG